jgi:2-oxoisovalerate dehydrogenase E1 component
MINSKLCYSDLKKVDASFTHRLSREQFLPVAYMYMFMSREMDTKFRELFRKGHVKGTVIISTGNEATTVGMALPFRSGNDIISILHRDLGAHLVLGMPPLSIFCQYMANENSPTHGREGNVHFSDASKRRFPMISHLGNMMAPTVGGVWGARFNGEDVFGLTTIGDGGSSTGDFHESINLAAVLKTPVVFIIENNGYAYSTPVKYQYACKNLSDRAVGYGIEGVTIDGTDPWLVYSTICDSLEAMATDQLPRLVECMTLRMEGHAAYDNAEYISDEEKLEWLEREPLKRTRADLMALGYNEDEVVALENEIREMIQKDIFEALKYARPSVQKQNWDVFAPVNYKKVKPFTADKIRNLTAINNALDFCLQEHNNAALIGQDIGVYESPFKSCKGLYKKYGGKRVVDMPVCESATAGFCLGASQTGVKPVMEFQFADFSTEAVTQVGLNAGTWYFRTGLGAPILFRLPCGGGITVGMFHSGEFEGLWTRFPGLKIFYPVTPQECYEAIVGAFHDQNPCLVMEHKLLYWSKQDSIDFDGDLSKIERPRCYTQGDKLTVVAFGAMVESALTVINKFNYSVQLWNPFILNPMQLGPILESVKETGKLLVIQESGETAGIGDKIISTVTRECFKELTCAPKLVGAPDIPVPFAKELETFYIPSQDRIREAIETMIGAKSE